MTWETALAVLAGVASTRAYMWLAGYRRLSRNPTPNQHREDH